MLHSIASYPYVTRNFLVNGQSMSCIDEGHGHPIVMLHGNPTWSFYYRNLAGELKNSYRVIVPDHIGCGLSAKPQSYSYTLSQHISNLDALIRQLDLDRLSLVVHDWGGAIGMGYAVAHPEKIQSIVITNTAAFRSQRIPWRIRICRTPFLGELLVRGLNGFARAALSMAVSKKMPNTVEAGYLYPYNNWQNRIAIHRFVKDIPLSANDASWLCLGEIEEGLERLQEIPKLLLWGGKDFCFTRHFFEEWRRRFPEAKYRYFDQAGHYLLEDEPQACSMETKRFFAAHSS